MKIEAAGSSSMLVTTYELHGALIHNFHHHEAPAGDGYYVIFILTKLLLCSVPEK
jgi:hypothetical protein